jgi:hypothetical protein
VLNSVFLYHCVQAGLDMAIVNPADVTPYAEIAQRRPRLAEDLVFAREPQALSPYITTSRAARRDAGEEDEAAEARDDVEQRIHYQILHRKPAGIEDADRPGGASARTRSRAQHGAAAGHEGGRRQVRRRRADPAVRAPERRGDEEGVAQLETYLEKTPTSPRAASCSRPCSATCTTSARTW